MCGGRCPSLFCEHVHGEIDGTLELTFDVAQFKMLTTHMNTAVDMACGRLVARVKRHGNSSLVVAEECSRIR